MPYTEDATFCVVIWKVTIYLIAFSKENSKYLEFLTSTTSLLTHKACKMYTTPQICAIGNSVLKYMPKRKDLTKLFENTCNISCLCTTSSEHSHIVVFIYIVRTTGLHMSWLSNPFQSIKFRNRKLHL
jgi:hypothetical protein